MRRERSRAGGRKGERRRRGEEEGDGECVLEKRRRKGEGGKINTKKVRHEIRGGPLT